MSTPVAKKSEAAYVSLHETRWPNFLRWKGSIILQVLPKVILITLYSTLITVLCLVQAIKIPQLVQGNSAMTILGLVISLLLVFRTNTAYERFWEGRKIWSTMVLYIRNISRMIWIEVKANDGKDIRAKRRAIKLLAGYAVAVKHYLREEYDVCYDDLYHLVKLIPKYQIPSSVEPLSGDNTLKARKKMKHFSRPPPSNLPLEISHYISSYNIHQFRRGTAEAPIFTVMTNTLNSLTDCLTSFERILRTPIPLAYGIHLSQTLLLYLLTLPPQIVNTMQWSTIPTMFIVSFIFFGIESIGGEIENPFGYDANDLPLDDFCAVIKAELDILVQTPPPNADEWAFADEEEDDKTVAEVRLNLE